MRAVQAVQEGLHPEDVVKALGLGKRCVYNWLCAVEGQEAVWVPMKLSPAQMALLYQTVAGTTPLQLRFEFASGRSSWCSGSFTTNGGSN